MTNEEKVNRLSNHIVKKHRDRATYNMYISQAEMYRCMILDLVKENEQLQKDKIEALATNTVIETLKVN